MTHNRGVTVNPKGYDKLTSRKMHIITGQKKCRPQSSKGENFITIQKKTHSKDLKTCLLRLSRRIKGDSVPKDIILYLYHEDFTLRRATNHVSRLLFFTSKKRHTEL